ncbi:MAG: hypothetical protein DME04_23585 [Candidatus Rokuibacteriota bacterium]|nr:MAG: hypothetical protein DME04_23585 [Candidatus Rokubacteria bacterium]
MTRAFVVVNPAAGGGRTGRMWRRLRDELARLGLSFETGETTSRGHATELARRAAAAGWPLVVAVGGDGTLNEVINGVTDARGASLATTGAILTGRGRDACRNFGLASDPHVAASRLVAGTDTRFDLGVAEWPDGTRRYFVSIAGAGFDAVVARRAASRGGRGTLPYLRAVVESLWSHRATAAALEVDGAPAPGLLTAAMVANGAYCGGGMRIAPAADPTDGALDLVSVGDLGRGQLLRWLPSVYRGSHLANPRVTARRARRVTIGARLATHLDGEPAAEGPVAFSVCPGALLLRR